MVLDPTTCLLGGIGPLQFPLRDNPVSVTSAATTRGWGFSIGENNQLFSGMPMINNNNSFITNSYMCGTTPNASCIASYGGLYVPPPGVLQTPDDGPWNGTPGNIGDDDGQREIGFNDLLKIGAVQIPGFPFYTYENEEEGWTNPSALSLGINSSFWDAALAVKAVGAKQWSVWTGTADNSIDGLLVLGAYDEQRATSDFKTYEVNQQHQRILLEITGIDWEASSGQTTNLMPNDTSSMLALVEPYNSRVDMPQDSYADFLAATNYTGYNETSKRYQWDERPDGNLVITLSDNTRTTIPARDLFNYPEKYNDRGYLDTFNTSYYNSRVRSRDYPDEWLWLGRPFLAQKLLVADWDRGVVHLADAYKGSITTPRLKSLCTGGAVTDTAGTHTDTAKPTVPSPSPRPRPTPTAAIAGGVVGGVSGLALIALTVFFVLRRHKRRKNQQSASFLPEVSEPPFRGSTMSPPPKYMTAGVYETAASPNLSQSQWCASSPPREMYSPPPKEQSFYVPPEESVLPSQTASTGSEAGHWRSSASIGATSGPLELPVGYDERYGRS